MENEENPFEQVQQFFKQFKGEINIIDQQIDIQLQMEYFEKARELKDTVVFESWEEAVSKLHDENISIEEKKNILTKLASIDEVKVYRAIEAYTAEADDKLKHWSLLALQESRMLLQSKLLEQSQVFVSTGLGGKGNKLRYFMVLFNKNNESFSELQQKVIKSEFDYIFKKQNSEIEEMHFFDTNASILALVPIDIAIQNLFIDAVSECNQYGNFIKENCIITNVRKMSPVEIREFMTKNNEQSSERSDSGFTPLE